ncbi:FAD/NAD(P)-binding domain-containing protein [Trametopsis cervina]|nr:FAD/NAD(P)-binding domain-containing protein [Trametopsis cervina]
MSAIPKRTQVLVVGGGPAGSFAASALAREGVDVVLLDLSKFPRYHIGESLLPSVRHYLRYIGAEEKVEKYGFARKPGSAIKFNQYMREGYTDFVALGASNNAWNVVRSEFDNLLLNHAAECGAKVFTQTKVESLDFAPAPASTTPLVLPTATPERKVFWGAGTSSSSASAAPASPSTASPERKVFWGAGTSSSASAAPASPPTATSERKVFWGAGTSASRSRSNSAESQDERESKMGEIGRPVKASYVGVDGVKGEIEFEYLVDASGRNGLLSTRYLKNRRYNQSLRNVAVWGYWRGTGMYGKGTPRENAPFFEALSDESGWAWFIPLHTGLTSVGVVMDQKQLGVRSRAASSATSAPLPPSGFSTTGQARQHATLADKYLTYLHLAPGVQALIGDDAVLERVRDDKDADGDAEDAPAARSASDFSYCADLYAGEGWRVVGDAGAFIDPFFSSGVHLAMTGGMSAAATIAASIRGDCTEREAAGYHTGRVAVSYTRFLVVVLSAYKQIRAQSENVLADIDEDNFDKAFEFFRPVIQGGADMGKTLSEDEVQRALDFCVHLFSPTTPEQHESVRKQLEMASRRWVPCEIDEDESEGAKRPSSTDRVENEGAKRPSSTDKVEDGKRPSTADAVVPGAFGAPAAQEARDDESDKSTSPEGSPTRPYPYRRTLSDDWSPLGRAHARQTSNTRPSAHRLLDVRGPIIDPAALARLVRSRLGLGLFRRDSGAGSASAGSEHAGPGSPYASLPASPVSAVFSFVSGASSTSEDSGSGDVGLEGLGKELGLGEAEVRMVLDKVNARRVIHAEHGEGLNSLEQEALGGWVIRLQRGVLGLARAG